MTAMPQRSDIDHSNHYSSQKHPTHTSIRFSFGTTSFPRLTCSAMPPKVQPPREQGVLWYDRKGMAWSGVDCGLMTGNFCDGGPALKYKDTCYASDRDPRGFPEVSNQRTPLCTFCETSLEYCRFCRGVSSCTPPPTEFHWSGTPQESGIPNGRHFTPAVRDNLVALWFQRRAAASRTYSSESALPKGYY